jgi:hypothetical protein
VRLLSTNSSRAAALKGLLRMHSAPTAGPVRPTSVIPQTNDSLFYQLNFQRPGIAEAGLERDPQLSIRTLLYAASSDAPPRSTGGTAGLPSEWFLGTVASSPRWSSCPPFRFGSLTLT